MKTTTTYPLRLPRSVKPAAEKMARDEGISLNQFVATAVAEKLAVINTAAFFNERKARADLAAFKRILKRKSGGAAALPRRATVGRLSRPFYPAVLVEVSTLSTP
jgi:hypothetical protein